MARNGSSFYYEAYVRASVDDVWNAITDGKQTARYFYGSRVKSTLKTGTDFVYMSPDGKERLVEATIFAIEPTHRLILDRYRMLYSPALAEDRPSREEWELTPMGEVCKVSIVHDGMSPNGPTYKDVTSGIPLIVSSMKSMLETGKALEMRAEDQG